MTQRVIESQKFGSSGEANDPCGAVKAKTESQTLVAANPGRVAVYITNDGEGTAYLALGVTAVKNEGIRLLKGDPPLRIADYTGVISVVTKEGEPVITFSEI